MSAIDQAPSATLSSVERARQRAQEDNRRYALLREQYERERDREPEVFVETIIIPTVKRPPRPSVPCNYIKRDGKRCNRKAAISTNRCQYHKMSDPEPYQPCSTCGLPTRCFDPKDVTRPLCNRNSCEGKKRTAAALKLDRIVAYCKVLLHTVPIEVLAKGRKVAPCSKCGLPTSVYKESMDTKFEDAVPYCARETCGKLYHASAGRPYRTALHTAVKEARCIMAKRAAASDNGNAEPVRPYKWTGSGYNHQITLETICRDVTSDEAE